MVPDPDTQDIGVARDTVDTNDRETSEHLYSLGGLNIHLTTPATLRWEDSVSHCLVYLFVSHIQSPKICILV